VVRHHHVTGQQQFAPETADVGCLNNESMRQFALEGQVPLVIDWGLDPLIQRRLDHECHVSRALTGKSKVILYERSHEREASHCLIVTKRTKEWTRVGCSVTEAKRAVNR